MIKPVETFEYHYNCLLNDRDDSFEVLNRIDLSRQDSLFKWFDSRPSELSAEFEALKSELKGKETIERFIRRERLYSLKIINFTIARILTSATAPSYMSIYLKKLSERFDVVACMMEHITKPGAPFLERCECLQSLILISEATKQGAPIKLHITDRQYIQLCEAHEMSVLGAAGSLEEIRMESLYFCLLDLLITCLSTDKYVQCRGPFNSLFLTTVGDETYTVTPELISEVGQSAVRVADFCIYPVSFIACRLSMTLLSGALLLQEDPAYFTEEIIELLCRLIPYHPMELGQLLCEQNSLDSGIAMVIETIVKNKHWNVLRGFYQLPSNPFTNALRKWYQAPVEEQETAVLKSDWSLGYFLGLRNWKLLLNELERPSVDFTICSQLLHFAANEDCWRMELFSPSGRDIHSRVICRAIQRCREQHEWLSCALKSLLVNNRFCLHPNILFSSLRAIQPSTELTSQIVTFIVSDDLAPSQVQGAAVCILLMEPPSSEQQLTAVDKCARNMLDDNSEETIAASLGWLTYRNKLDKVSKLASILENETTSTTLFSQVLVAMSEVSQTAAEIEKTCSLIEKRLRSESPEQLDLLFIGMREYFLKRQHWRARDILASFAENAPSPLLYSASLDLRAMLPGPSCEPVRLAVPSAQACVESSVITMCLDESDTVQFHFPPKPWLLSPLSLLVLPSHPALLIDLLVQGQRLALPRLVRYLQSSPKLCRNVSGSLGPSLLTVVDNGSKFVLANLLLRCRGISFLELACSILLQANESFSVQMCPLLCTVIQLEGDVQFECRSEGVQHALKLVCSRFSSNLQKHESQDLTDLLEPLLVVSPSLASLCIDPQINPADYPLLIRFREDGAPDFRVEFENCARYCTTLVRSSDGSDLKLLDRLILFLITQGVLFLLNSDTCQYGIKQFLRAELDSLFAALAGQTKRRRRSEEYEANPLYKSLSCVYKSSFARL